MPAGVSEFYPEIAQGGGRIALEDGEGENGEPTIEWLLENQDKIVHSYHQKGLDGKL